MISYLLLFCDETLTKITGPGKTPQKKEIASKQKSLESFQSNELNLL